MYNDINFEMFKGQINAGEPIAYYPLADEKVNFVLTKTRSQSFIIPQGWSNAGMHAVYIEGRAGYVSMEHSKC